MHYWTALLDLALVCHPLLAYLATRYPKVGVDDSRKRIFYFSFLAILALRYAAATPPNPTTLSTMTTSSTTTTTPNTTTPGAPPAADVCPTHDQPNPIAHIYPNNATGVLNGTVSLLPIPLALARQLIPPQYRILEHAYRALLPAFPADMYPAVLQAMHDHEVQAFGYKIADFSRAGLEFPFLDLLADNTTSFKWVPSLLMSATNPIALTGAKDYGIAVYPAAFDPPCDAYRASKEPEADEGTTLHTASSIDAQTSLHTTFHASPSSLSPTTPLSFYHNVTNQPIFSDGRTCDNMVRLFDTSLSTGSNSIERVRGDVRMRMWPFDVAAEGERTWDGVEGIRFASAFVENNYLPCEGFRGYDGRVM